ncbi:MAG: GntR family transcriptional regulator [Clostridia bacterium]|nr:GntR family transcriptional regulator [Clostridia bacterium]
MNIIISNMSGVSIYEQIYEQIKNCIMSGELKEGDALPSIRALAKDLRISVITTKRAYDELEKEGFIYTVAAKGCYVARKDTELIKEIYLKQIEEHMRAVLQLSRSCDLSEEDLAQMFSIIQKEE